MTAASFCCKVPAWGQGHVLMTAIDTNVNNTTTTVARKNINPEFFKYFNACDVNSK
jgi:hypothetical protein